MCHFSISFILHAHKTEETFAFFSKKKIFMYNSNEISERTIFRAIKMILFMISNLRSVHLKGGAPEVGRSPTLLLINAAVLLVVCGGGGGGDIAVILLS